MLLSSDEWARAHGHEPLAYLRDAQVSAVDFVHGEGLLMAPTVAVPEMLKRHGLSQMCIRDSINACNTVLQPTSVSRTSVASEQ